MSTKFLSSVFYTNKPGEKHKMYVTAIVASFTKLSEFGSLEFEICIEVWFWINGSILTTNGNLLQNAKHET